MANIAVKDQFGYDINNGEILLYAVSAGGGQIYYKWIIVTDCEARPSWGGDYRIVKGIRFELDSRYSVDENNKWLSIDYVRPVPIVLYRWDRSIKISNDQLCGWFKQKYSKYSDKYKNNLKQIVPYLTEYGIDISSVFTK